jgi:uncharacterized integral membrane protein
MTDTRRAEATESPSAQARPDATPQERARRHRARIVGPTRISGTWVGIIVGAVTLVLLLVFVLQNTKSAKVSFLAFSGHIPLGVALVFAAVAGVLLAAIAASLRIMQIRRRLARGPRDAAGTVSPVAPTDSTPGPVDSSPSVLPDASRADVHSAS